MRLSECGDSELRVLRDAEFRSLGLLTHAPPSMLAFIESERFLPNLIGRDNVSCVITDEQLSTRIPDRLGLAVSAQPRASFMRLHNRLALTDFYFTPFPTVIAASAHVHPRAYVAETSVRIGERVVIEPNATVLERSVLEDDVVVRAGSVIGGEGFQFMRLDGDLVPIEHAGGTHLARGVEVQHATCIDRAVFGGFTHVGEGTRIDNLVHVAHNCVIGKRNLIVAGAMIGGSVVTGDDVWIGPQASISSEVHLADRAFITLGSVVTRDVAVGERVTGNFAIPHERFLSFLRGIR